MQARRLRCEQLHSRVQHIQLNSRARIEARFGQAQRFIGQFDVFFLAFNELLVLLQIRISGLYLQLDLPNVVIVSDLCFGKEGALLDDLTGDRAAVPDWQATLDQCGPTF